MGLDSRTYIRAGFGALSGAVAGVTLARLSLPVMNYILGAGEFLKAAIENELKSHQPHKHVTKGFQNELDDAKIQGAVKSTLDQIDSWEGVPGKDQLWANIQSQGEEVLKEIATWLVQKYSGELVTNEGVCWRLFECAGVFACTEAELVALSFLDIPLFLIQYFDPEWTVQQYLNTQSKDSNSWTRTMYLKQVYISNPDVKTCEQNSEGEWQIKRVFLD